jgi:hypothetical protein
MYHTHASVVFLTFLAAAVRSLQHRRCQLVKVRINFMNEPESILEPAMDVTKMCHATSASSLSALGLQSPVVAPQFGRWVTTLSAS